MTVKSSQKWIEADILSLINEGVKESLGLDYKACASLLKTDRSKNEISKDVSAFANSAGGVIIYGVKEDGHIPTEIDCGFDPRDISKEWLEQVINSSIHPRIDGLLINQVELNTTSTGRVLYVVSIPQATTRAPHQASDHRYYKRFNFESVAMEDYEIKDILRRASSPDLYFDFSFGYEREIPVQFLPDQDFSQAIGLTVSVGNQAKEPACYAVMSIWLDSQIKIIDSAGLTTTQFILPDHQNIPVTILRQNWAIPGKLPIFKETQFSITDNPIKIAIPAEHAGLETEYMLGWQISSPGMSNFSIGKLTLANYQLKINISKHASLNS